MCAGDEYMMMGGQLAEAGAKYSESSYKASMLSMQADQTRFASKQRSQSISRAGERERGAARAAAGASGATIDEAALRVEDGITRGAERDAAMEMISGELEARQLESRAMLHRMAGSNAIWEGVIGVGATGFSGWKGAKGRPAPSYHSEAYWAGGAGFEGE
ncbi:hypothetical protein [Methylibium petroleiphilum]|uniref:hypothetical protein n=1 Tax=Methylibium petroleiphilum TaxID=105560 RepID=UPI003D2D17E1